MLNTPEPTAGYFATCPGNGHPHAIWVPPFGCPDHPAAALVRAESGSIPALLARAQLVARLSAACATGSALALDTDDAWLSGWEADSPRVPTVADVADAQQLYLADVNSSAPMLRLRR